MSSPLDQNTLNYLVSLVRQDMRRHQKSIERFGLRHDQSSEEIRGFLARFTRKQEYRARVAAKLRELLEPGSADEATTTGGRQ